MVAGRALDERKRAHRVAACAVLLALLAPGSEGGGESLTGGSSRRSSLVGTVSRELMERPVPLRASAGHLHQEVTTSSPEAQAYYDQGIAYLASYSWIDASRSFHEALRRDPKLAMAYLGMARAYAGACAYDEAREQLARARQLEVEATDKERAWIEAGDRYLEVITAPRAELAGKRSAYRQAVDALLELAPEDPNALALRGSAEEAGLYLRGAEGGGGAMGFYEKALEIDPEHLTANHYLAHCSENMGRYEQAERHARKFAAAASGVPHAVHMLGHMLPRRERWEESLRQFQRADALHRAYAAAEQISPEEDWHFGHNLHALGVVHLRLGNHEEAQRVFREAFRLPTREPVRDLRRGRLAWPEYLILEGRFAEALTVAQELERRPQGDAQVFGAQLVAEALLELGRPDEAKAAATRASSRYALLKAELANDPVAIYLPHMIELPHKILVAQIALTGDDAWKAELTLAKLAGQLATAKQFDSWLNKLYDLERLARHVERAERPELLRKLQQAIHRIDPSFESATEAKDIEQVVAAGPEEPP